MWPSHLQRSRSSATGFFCNGTTRATICSVASDCDPGWTCLNGGCSCSYTVTASGSCGTCSGTVSPCYDQNACSSVPGCSGTTSCQGTIDCTYYGDQSSCMAVQGLPLGQR